MRPRSLSLAAAALTFVVGVASTGLRPAPLRLASPPESVAPPSKVAAPEAGRQKEPEVSDIFVEDDKLTYNGYVVQRRHKRVTLEYPPEMKVRPSSEEFSYAVLKRKGKVLATFDGVYSGAGNITRFGLFPFLGGDEKQLLVTQDVPRGGRQWIVSLSQDARVVFDSEAFEVGREGDDMSVVDLDGDGVYELRLLLTAFYGFSDWALAPAATPLSTVVFKYDAAARKYLPANRHFARRLLADADALKKKVPGPEDPARHLSAILGLVLTYVLAGEEQAAWAFYEEAYKLHGKAEMKKKIKAELSAHPVYRFTYKGKAGR